MAARANYVKIGWFVMLGVGAAFTLVFVIGQRRLHRETVSYFTYFDESVTGLEVGAPVKARGVTIGQVGNITFAPDHRLVEVRSDLDIAALERLGLREPGLPVTANTAPPPDTRAQLGSQGLTGVKYILFGFFNPKTNPPPPLSFPAPERYLPAAVSVQKGIEDSVARAMDGLSELVGTMTREKLADKIVLVATEADEVLRESNRLLKDAGRQDIARRAGATLDELRVAVNKVGKALDRLDGKDGLLATTQRSIESVGNAGRNATDAALGLGETLAGIRRAADSIHLLADELERDPDMLVKGRAKGRAP